MFYYNKKSKQKIVHTAACNYCITGDIGAFPTSKEAYAAGYRLCKLCNPVFIHYRKERCEVQTYCAKNGLLCTVGSSAITVITPRSQWKIICNGSGKALELYHKNTQCRNTESIITGYHFQNISYHSLMEHLQYIFSHDAYRLYHPCPAPTHPRPTPQKGTKRYVKEQARRKRAERRSQTKNVLALIDQISLERQSTGKYVPA